jgi:hypothetical protein
MRHDRIIDLFGGNTALGKLVGRSDSAVSRWRDNGIPPNMWPIISVLARQQGIRGASIESLAAGPPTMTQSYRTRGSRSEPVG